MTDSDVAVPEEQKKKRVIVIEVLGTKQYQIGNEGVDIESIPLILRKVALDIERQMLQ